MNYSFIIPCFNRQDEVKELLESFVSLKKPEGASFEIIFVDGSPTEILRPVIDSFQGKALSINHIHKPKLPISPSRNLGAEQAKGEYLVFLDSDVILPPDYLNQVDKFLKEINADSFGGPDRAHESFTNTQKAISYAMTSFLTTGGIRGGKKQIHQFNPRGFNMGIMKNVFESVHGYSNMTCGEDIELSIRIIKAGYKVLLNPNAYVYHKRRSTFKSFFRQVFRFGAARINIFKRHRSELKLTHMLPAAFVIFFTWGLVAGLFLSIFLKYFAALLGFYFLVIFFQSTFINKSIAVGAMSIIASLLQLTGYGCGFLANAWTVFVLRKQEGIALGASK